MAEISSKASLWRLVGAVILGFFVGTGLFFCVALVIGMINDLSGSNIPIGTRVTENLGSAFILVVLIVICIAGFSWRVWTTPPVVPVYEIPETIDKF
jgi:hypothetical protein